MVSQETPKIMQKEFMIYDYDRKIFNTWKMIESELSSENIRLIHKYDKEIINNGLAKATRLKQLQVLLSLSRKLQKNWTDVTKDDIDDLVSRIMTEYATNSGKETSSTWDHKKILKIFFRWFKLGSRNYRDVGDPMETKSVKLKTVKSSIVREQLIDDNDVKKLIHACNGNLRDVAFIDVHSEAGTRPGEILSLKIKHVKFDQYGAIIAVDGKTGTRPVRIVSSVPNLASWLDSHPLKENPNAPLWIQLDNLTEPLDEDGARALLCRLVERSNLSKRINLKLFRHSEATKMASHLTEMQMRLRHGWTPSSKMPENYVHMNNADVDQAILSQYGIVPQNKESMTLPKKCHICDMPNAPSANICHKCGKPLDIETALDMEKQREEKETLRVILAKVVCKKKLSEEEMKYLLQHPEL